MNIKSICQSVRKRGLVRSVYIAIIRATDKVKCKPLLHEIVDNYSRKTICSDDYLGIINKLKHCCSAALDDPKNPKNKVKLELLLFDYREACEKRPFSNLDNKESEEFKEIMKWYFKTETVLRKGLSAQFNKFQSHMMALYIKNRLPECYLENSVAPVQEKLVFMENVNCPSPTNSHLIKVLRKQEKYEIVTIGLKRRKVSEIEYYENALNLIKESANAKAIFLSTANDLFSWIDLRAETKLIQLWHGVGMFKKVGWSTVDKHFGRGASAREEYDQYRNYSYVTIAGKEQAWTFEDAMHIPADSGVIVPVGISRTDVFYDEGYFESIKKKLYTKLPQIKGKKIILYAPTFRGSVRGAKAPDKLDVNLFGEALSDEYVLFIKHHGLSKDVPPIPEKWKDTFAFDMGEKKILGIESLLAVADICISDYSSVAFEYAILERPLIFFAYDMEEYLDARGMYYDYEEITPGPVCKTTEEMVDYILHIDERFDKQEVIDFKNKYVEACDGHATERTIALIEN